MHNPLAWIGLAGVEDIDTARAHAWEKRLHGVMLGAEGELQMRRLFGMLAAVLVLLGATTAAAAPASTTAARAV